MVPSAIAVMAVCVIALVACAKPPPQAPITPAKPKLKLAVLAVESDRFPKIAAAATASLAQAQVAGVDEVEVSKVSIEVVQLSIECLEQTPDCYEAVGRSLAANRLLFARITPTSKRRRDLRVTVTLFDVDTREPTRTAEKTFRSEKDAAAGLDALISEATR